ncbi:MAG: hypothetical protein N2170_01865 [Bacteroidia bacterium]|nr:hypothetical protein [Bacteroidia bacterium]
MKSVQTAGKALLLASLLWGCKKEKKDGASDIGHGRVTTVEIYLVQGQDTVKGRYKDPDGPGGRLPTVDTLRPAAGSVYSYVVRVLNESGNPVEDLTAVIFEQQKNTHRLFLLPVPDSLALIEPTDADDLGRPVGGRGRWMQGPVAFSSGTVRILLRHYLNPTDKNFGLERGSSDIDVFLPVRSL